MSELSWAHGMGKVLWPFSWASGGWQHTSGVVLWHKREFDFGGTTSFLGKGIELVHDMFLRIQHITLGALKIPSVQTTNSARVSGPGTSILKYILVTFMYSQM